MKEVLRNKDNLIISLLNQLFKQTECMPFLTNRFFNNAIDNNNNNNDNLIIKMTLTLTKIIIMTTTTLI